MTGTRRLLLLSGRNAGGFMKGFGRLAAMMAAAVLAVFPSAVPTVRAQAPDITALSQLTGPEREARLVEGARKEAGVNVYTSLVVEDIAAAAAAFEKKYAIKVK